MASPMESIKMIELVRVRPSDSSITEFSLPLTFFDILWIKFTPNEQVIFYQLTNPTHQFFHSTILPELKRSLSIALNHYVPLAGNIVWNSSDSKPILLYKAPNDAVSLTVAESTSDMSHLSGNNIRQAIEYHSLVPELSVSDRKASNISLQVTFFNRQGFSIGITSHHAVVDGKTMSMFLKSWAYICNQFVQDDVIRQLPDELIPFFDRSSIKNPVIGLDMMLLNLRMGGDASDPSKGNLKMSPIQEVNPNLVRYTFVLTRRDIEKLREKVVGSIDTKQARLSTFVLAFSYVLLCMIKTKGRGDDGDGGRGGGGSEDESLCFVFVADFRSRLDPPLPSNYFGNCVMGIPNTSKVGDFMKEDGLVLAANKLSDDVSRLSSETLETMYEGVKSMLSYGGAYHNYRLAGSNSLGFYGTDFGWGRPVKTEILSIDRTGAIAMLDGRNESGGVEIGVSLTRCELEVFSTVFADGLKGK